MRADELQKLLSQRPFEPIRLHISSGQTVDIHHPELAIVSRSLVFVAVPLRGKRAKPGDVFDYVAHYNLLHIVKIEPLNGTTTRARTRRGRQ